MNAVHDITHSMLSCLISFSVCVNYNILLLTFAMGLSPRSLSLSLHRVRRMTEREKGEDGFFFFLFFLFFFWLRFHSTCCHCVDPVCSADADDYLFIFLVRVLIYFIDKWVD